MKQKIIPVSLFFLVATLTGCQTQGLEQSPQAPVQAILSIIPLTSNDLQEKKWDLPSASLGVFAGTFLMHPSLPKVQTALKGVQNQLMLLFSQRTEQNDIFQTLEELESITTLNLPDLLNRSTDRKMALERHITNLEAILRKASLKKKELDAKVTMYKKEQKVQKKETRDIDRSLRKSMKDGDYIEAGKEQGQLGSMEGDLQELEVKLDSLRDTLKILDQLLIAAQERLGAIEKNREILIAGLRVHDMPGLQNLGFVHGEKRRRSR